MIKTFITGVVKEFCTPVTLDIGYVLDPTSALIAAKQLSQNLTRNVQLKVTLRERDIMILSYFIQPGPHQATVNAVEIRMDVPDSSV